MKSYKGRTIEKGQEVKVYFNLHKHVFSIKDKKTGLVLAHTPTVRLEGASFEVNQKGRERVIKEKRKNVHAFVIGRFIDDSIGSEERVASYNPYKNDSFVDDGGKVINSAESVTLKDKKVFYQIT